MEMNLAVPLVLLMAQQGSCVVYQVFVFFESMVNCKKNKADNSAIRAGHQMMDARGYWALNLEP